MKKICFFIALGAFISCQQSETKTENKVDDKNNTAETAPAQLDSTLLDKVVETSKVHQLLIDDYLKKQSDENDIEKVFAYDDSVAQVKVVSDSIIKGLIELSSEKIELAFKQTENSDRFTVKSLYVSSAKQNTLQIEGEVTAIENSNASVIYISVSGFSADGKRLDVSGGLEFNERIEAGKTYTFKGEIKNIKTLEQGATFKFDQYIEKW